MKKYKRKDGISIPNQGLYQSWLFSFGNPDTQNNHLLYKNRYKKLTYNYRKNKNKDSNNSRALNRMK